eukprot:scaffold193377_cov35-Tisochrysis_lutea.AAC.2
MFSTAAQSARAWSHVRCTDSFRFARGAIELRHRLRIPGRARSRGPCSTQGQLHAPCIGGDDLDAIYMEDATSGSEGRALKYGVRQMERPLIVHEAVRLDHTLADLSLEHRGADSARDEPLRLEVLKDGVVKGAHGHVHERALQRLAHARVAVDAPPRHHSLARRREMGEWGRGGGGQREERAERRDISTRVLY